VTLLTTAILVSTLLTLTLTANFNLGHVASNNQFAFAQEGKIRCTSGNLVSSPSGCPASDECPSAPSGTEVAQCTLRDKSETENEEESEEESDVNSQDIESIMSAETDKKNYESGDTVKITLRNNGNEPIRISGLNFSLTILNPTTNENYTVVERPASMLAVDAGTSRTYEWDQKDDIGDQVEPGNYTALAILGPFRGNTTFTISE
jgi:hypothetical protein